MRSMRRRLFMAVSVLSLVACAGIIALWVRSLSVADSAGFSRPAAVNGRYARTDWSVLSTCGFLSFTVSQMVPIDDASAVWLRNLDAQSKVHWYIGPVEGYPFSLDAFWEGVRRIGASSGSHVIVAHAVQHWRAVEFPLWPALLIVSIPSQMGITRLYRHRRRRPRKRDTCEKCGYSLTGNISGVCPECGNLMPAEAKA